MYLVLSAFFSSSNSILANTKMNKTKNTVYKLASSNLKFLFLSIEDTGSCICLTLDLDMSHVSPQCVSVVS